MIARIPNNNLTIPWGQDTGFEFTVDFTQDYSAIEPSNTSLTLVGDAKKEFIEHINTRGRLAAIDVVLELTQANGSIFPINMVNTSEIEVGESKVILPLKPKFDPDNFQSMANGLSFRVLGDENNNLLTDDVFIYADRIIVSSAKGVDFILIAGNYLTTSIAFADAVNDLANSIANFIQALSPNPVNAIAAAAKLVAMLAKFAVVLLAIINLWNEIINLIFPPVRKYKCIRLNKLVELCCTYLGYTLESDLLYNIMDKATIAPVPKKETDTTFLNTALNFQIPNSAGIPLESDIFSTFGQLLEWMRTTFNAKVRVVNNTVKIENELSYLLNPTLDLEDFLTDQQDREDVNSWNNDNLFKSKLVKLQDDIGDYWTLDDQIKRHYQVECRMNEPYEKRLLDGGLEEINVSYAFGVRKNTLSFIEKTLATTLKLVDDVVSFFGGNTSLESKITNRVGAFITSEEVFNVTKLLWLNDDGRQPVDYKGFIGAGAIYNLFHKYREPELYNWEERTYEMPCTDEIFLSLLDNNVFLSEGKKYLVRSMSYSPDYGSNNGGRLSLTTWVESEVTTGVFVEIINDGTE